MADILKVLVVNKHNFKISRDSTSGTSESGPVRRVRTFVNHFLNLFSTF